MSSETVVTKSIRLNSEENRTLQRISQVEGLSEAALMKRFVLEGIFRYRLEQAITAYEHGESDLSAAARHAGISIYQMMNELEQRGVESSLAREKFVEGLETLAQTFGGSEALFDTIAELKGANEN
jgi:predicted HTH domain antitoxin